MARLTRNRAPFFILTFLLIVSVLALIPFSIFLMHSPPGSGVGRRNLLRQQTIHHSFTLPNENDNNIPPQVFLTSDQSEGVANTETATVNYATPIERRAKTTTNTETISELRRRLPPSVWTLAGSNSNPIIAANVTSHLSPDEISRAMSLCGKFLYSTIHKAVSVIDLGSQTFVSTGDIDDMWTRDSAVQMGLYVGRMKSSPALRLIIEGAIRRQAFNILQDPYANAYNRRWKDPTKLDLKDRVIGRGGWVATRNYELDSGAYFLTQLYDYYVAEGLYRPEALLDDPIIFDAVNVIVDTWIVEQHHDEKSHYRYFELPEGGKGPKTKYTGMTWSGFRPSDDPCKHGYHIPSNIFAAAGLERTLELNERIWHSNELRYKTSQLLEGITKGIRDHGTVTLNTTGETIYAYEVDGFGNSLADFDDANVPSLLSIPLLGWGGYDDAIYASTRKRLLSSNNEQYYAGDALRGIGSPHTPPKFVWPMALVIEALTTSDESENRVEAFVFQLRQLMKSACNDAMHESVNSNKGCNVFTREWFEWANALFVVLVETALGERCDDVGRLTILDSAANAATVRQRSRPRFHTDPYKNNHTIRDFYQGVEASVKHSSS